MATIALGSGGAAATANQGYPTTTQNAVTTNFTSLVDFGSGTEQTPFLPETLDKQVKRFGNRSISGLLSKMAAEYALQSDTIQWTEQDRLHLRYDSITRGAAVDSSASTDEGKTFTFPLNHSVRVGQTVILVNTTALVTTGTAGRGGQEHKGRVRSVSGRTVVIDSYATVTSLNAGFANLGVAGITATIYGSEFAKGSLGMDGSLDVTYVNRSNQPIILKDKYSVSGSDVAQIGWIEVQDVNGDGGHGYLWYLQSEMDQRARFMDYVETALVEAVPAATGSPALALVPTDSQAGAIRGSRGLFYELEQYGNTFTGGFNDGGTSRQGLADFDTILNQLDTQGNIEENMLYLNRAESLAFDNILGSQSDFTANGGGPSWGAFSNSKDMALHLGFSGVTRGSYSFYKTDWKYLNDVTGRRAYNDSSLTTGSAGSNIQGILVPGGSSSVYDEMLSSTIKRPMLHVRYRAASGENRKLKNWVTGSVGGVYTSDADRMDVHYLSERCLVVQGANNFGLFKNR